jgi:hypothetical protein
MALGNIPCIASSHYPDKEQQALSETQMFFGFCRMISARAASQAAAHHAAQDRLCIAVCLTLREKVVLYV